MHGSVSSNTTAYSYSPNNKLARTHDADKMGGMVSDGENDIFSTFAILSFSSVFLTFFWERVCVCAVALSFFAVRFYWFYISRFATQGSCFGCGALPFRTIERIYRRHRDTCVCVRVWMNGAGKCVGLGRGRQEREEGERERARAWYCCLPSSSSPIHWFKWKISSHNEKYVLYLYGINNNNKKSVIKANECVRTSRNCVSGWFMRANNFVHLLLCG